MKMKKNDKLKEMEEMIKMSLYDNYVVEQELKVLTEEVRRLSDLIEAFVWENTEEVEKYE